MKDVIVIVSSALVFIGLAVLLFRAFEHAAYNNDPTEWHDPPITEAAREKQAWLKRIQTDEFGKYPGSGPAERAERVSDAEKFVNENLTPEDITDIVTKMKQKQEWMRRVINERSAEAHRGVEGFDDDRR